MKRLSPSLLDSLITLDRSASTPLYQQLYRAIQRAINESILSPGARLPSTRAMTKHLDISRNTVTKAFEQLRQEGYLESQVGSGTYVSDELPERHTEVDPPDDGLSRSLQLADIQGRSRSLSEHAGQAVEKPFSVLDDPDTQMAFRPGVPALDAFPLETWSTLTSRRWRAIPAERLVYGDPAGYAPLREAVAEYLRTARGVRCEAEQILIVGGVQQAFMLTAQLLVDPGDRVCVEDPGFPRMRRVFEAVGAHVASAPVDDEGIDFSTVAADPLPRLVGITPSHQYPTGTTMTLSRRIDLLEWAAENEVWILEDDYDSEFRYSGQPIAALQGLDNAGRVIYTGTFSKVLFPALRLGYIVLPPDLVEPFTKMRSLSTRCSHRVSQMILTDFIREGYFEQHIRRMRTLYAARQAALLQAIDAHLADIIDVAPDDAGLHLVGRLPEGVDDQEVADRLKEHDIVAPPLSFYSERPLDRGGLLLGYSGVPEETIHEKVQQMEEILTPFSP